MPYPISTIICLLTLGASAKFFIYEKVINYLLVDDDERWESKWRKKKSNELFNGNGKQTWLYFGINLHAPRDNTLYRWCREARWNLSKNLINTSSGGLPDGVTISGENNRSVVLTTFFFLTEEFCLLLGFSGFPVQIISTSTLRVRKKISSSNSYWIFKDCFFFVILSQTFLKVLVPRIYIKLVKTKFKICILTFPFFFSI